MKSNAWKQRNAWHAALGDDEPAEKENDVPRSTSKTTSSSPLKPANKPRNSVQTESNKLRGRAGKRDAPLHIKTRTTKKQEKKQEKSPPKADILAVGLDVSSMDSDAFNFPTPEQDSPPVQVKEVKNDRSQKVQTMEPDILGGVLDDFELSPLDEDELPASNELAQDLLADFGIHREPRLENPEYFQEQDWEVDQWDETGVMAQDMPASPQLSPILSKRKSIAFEEPPAKRRVGFAQDSPGTTQDSLPSRIRQEILAKQKQVGNKQRRRMRHTMVVQIEDFREFREEADENKPPVQDKRQRRVSIMARPVPDLPASVLFPNYPVIEVPTNAILENPFLDQISVVDEAERATLENTKKNARPNRIQTKSLPGTPHDLQKWDESPTDIPEAMSPIVQALSLHPTPNPNRDDFEFHPHYTPAPDVSNFKVHEDASPQPLRRSSVAKKHHVVLDHSNRSILAAPEDLSIVEEAGDRTEGEMINVVGHGDKSIVEEYSKIFVEPFAIDSVVSEVQEVQEAAINVMNRTLDAAVRTILHPTEQHAPQVSLVGLQELIELCEQNDVKTKTGRAKRQPGKRMEGALSWSQGLLLHGKTGTYDLLAHMRKLAEATYSEVYTCALPSDFELENEAAQQHLLKSGGQVVIKIMPFNLDQGDPEESSGDDSEEKLDMLWAPQVWSEIACTKSLAALPGSLFGGYLCAKVVRGHFPHKLLKDWDKWDKNKVKLDQERLQAQGDEDWQENAVGSENLRPDVYDDDQLFALLVMPHGGCDLESFEVKSWSAARSIWSQVVLGLAIAEEKRRFEHRDLHWGNVLVAYKQQEGKVPMPPKRRKDAPEPKISVQQHVDLELASLGRVTMATNGVSVRIIDYTLGRFEDGTFQDLFG
jgi:hypothetical protein